MRGAPRLGAAPHLAACFPKRSVLSSRRAKDAAKGSAMTLPRRTFLHLAAGAAALPLRRHRAQSYPSRPVRIIVGFARRRRLRHRRAPDRRNGSRSGWASNSWSRTGPAPAATSRPRRWCARAPDGYTLLLVGPPNAINATLYQKLNFNFLRDIVPVASINREPSAGADQPVAAGAIRFRNSSPMPKPIRARSTTHRPAPARPATSPARCSR